MEGTRLTSKGGAMLFLYSKQLRGIQNQIRELRDLLHQLRREITAVATKAQVKEAFNQLNDEINKIGQEVVDLVTQLKASPDAERDEIVDQLHAVAQKLTDFEGQVIV